MARNYDSVSSPAPRPGPLPTPWRALACLVCLCLAAAATSAVGSSASSAFGAASAGSDERFELGAAVFHQRTLGNGLVALAAREGKGGAEADAGGTVSIFLAVDAGRRYETVETNGLAHLAEHALYTGTAQTAANEHDARIHELGGESNASTRDDYILVYDHLLPVDALDEVLAMEADRLRGLTFDRAAVLHERDRLRDEEIRTYTRAMAREERLESVAFPDHPYGVGLLESRRAQGASEDGLHTRGPELSVEQIRAFYDAHYHPNRVALVVAGAIEPTRALDAVERAFGSLPRGPDAPAVRSQAPPAAGAPGLEHRFASSLPADRLEWLWIGPARGEADRAALAVLARWLGRQTGTDGAPIEASMGGRLDADLFRLASSGSRAETELAALLERVRDRPLPADELAETRALLRDDVDGLALRGRPYFSLASEVAIYALHGHLDVLRGHASAIDGVTAEQVLAAARRWLDPASRRSVRFVGTGEERPALPEDAGELRQLAMDASESGQLDLAVQAYSRLLTLGPNRMNTVIYLASRGQLRVEQKDYAGAIRDYEEALAVVDYPAVRDLLDEARRLQAGGLRTAPSTDSAGAEPGPAGETASGTAPETSPDTAAEPASLEQEIESMQRQIEDWRGRTFLRPVEVERVASDEVDDPDLAGWYEPATERLVVVERNSAAFRRGTLLHELFHALQDQHFDLEALRQQAGDSVDAQEALSALIEGEAMLAVTELLSYDFESHAVLPSDGELEEARYQKLFQYADGLRFVRARRNAGGWQAVDAAWQSPPRSTREIFHPELYPRSPETLSMAPAPFEAPAGRRLEDGRWGQNRLRFWLARSEATRAASARMAARVIADRYQRFELPRDSAGRQLETWDLELEDERSAARFARFAEPVLADEGWQLRVVDRFVRLSRRVTPSASTTAPGGLHSH